MLRLIATAVLVTGTSLAATPAAFAQNLVPCARENDFCRVPYPTQVIYGAHGRHAVREVAGRGIPCSNGAFGDPAPGIPKHCVFVARDFRERRHGEWSVGPGHDFPRRDRRLEGAVEAYGPSVWRTCAPENGFCRFPGVRRVRYGARGRFVEGTYRGGVSCSNGVFGDPTPGLPKSCQVLD